jgi:hypothetical protein
MDKTSKKIIFPILYTVLVYLLGLLWLIVNYYFSNFSSLGFLIFVLLCIFTVPLVGIFCLRWEGNAIPSFIDHVRYNLWFYVISIMIITPYLFFYLLMFFMTGRLYIEDRGPALGYLMGFSFLLPHIGVIFIHFITVLLLKLINKIK